MARSALTDTTRFTPHVPPRTRRGGLLGEFALAAPPTLTILLVLFLVEALVRERLLFASLAASAFLIYRAPLHRMNSVRVMVTAQVVGVFVGILASLALTPGYVAAGAAMVVTIVLLILCDVVHPPAIPTALGFAFIPHQGHAVGIFLLALGMTATLVVLQRLALWTMHRFHLATGKDDE